jgi:predicted ATP-grasp superfamily ATP-dependent carboligase
MPRRALVTDSDERSALAACRALAAAGYEVSAATSSHGPAPGSWSRSVRRRIRLPDPRIDGETFVAALERELRAQPQDVLVCSTEAAALAVSAGRTRIDGLCRHGLPAHEVLERCLDKVGLLETAAGAGLESPPSSVCDSGEDARMAAQTYGFPVMVKPRRSLIGRGSERAHRGSIVADGPHELRKAIARFGLPVIVQQREPGEIYSVGGVVADGALFAYVVSRYERTWPPRAGSASFSETVEPPPELLARTERLLSSLAYEGLFEVELIRRRDGRFQVIDFNPRIYGSLTLAEAAGANLVAIWCDRLLGDADLRPAAARAGVRYRFDDAELRNAVDALRRGRIRGLLGVLRPRAHVAHAYFRWSDPGPLAGRLAQLAWTGLVRATPPLHVRTQTAVALAFHRFLAYAIGVPVVLLARLVRALRPR